MDVFQIIFFFTVVLRFQVSKSAGSDYDRSRKFLDPIHWIQFDETLNDNPSRVKRDNSDLDLEEVMNEPLRLAMAAARENSAKIIFLTQEFEDIPLSAEEVTLIMAYTYDVINPNVIPFYRDLNADCRENGLEGGKYPVAKHTLRNSLININSKRPTSWYILHRREPEFVLDHYGVYLNTDTKVTVNQFTSTSNVSGAFPSPEDYIFTRFVESEVGVSIKAFSEFPHEEEVLLPAFYGAYTVESITYSNKTVVLHGPLIASSTTNDKCSMRTFTWTNILITLCLAGFLTEYI